MDGQGKVVLIGALDTKGEEFQYIKSILENLGIPTLTINTGVLGEPTFVPDISAETVAQAAGSDLRTLISEGDRGQAVSTMALGAAEIVKDLASKGRISGIFGMGGTAGTTVAAASMKAVPIGIPKLLVSTVASGNTRPYVGVKDVTMMYSVIDIAGINALSEKILGNAARALAGMVKFSAGEAAREARPMVGLTMFGVTTPCCTRIREQLESRGYEVLVFHATGTGGMAMEDLIRAGFIHGVIDVTTTELADELVGGIFSAGPDRLSAAGEAGIPQIISVGALDMVNFGPPDTVPEEFAGRLFYQHNATTTLMRTTTEENEELGRRLGQRVSRSKGPAKVLFPKGGVSLLDLPGKAFEGVKQREALLQGIKQTLSSEIPMVEMNEDINDPAFADALVQAFLQAMNNE